jgi:hypothetical protein
MGTVVSILLFVGFFYLMMKFGCGAHVHRGGCGHAGHHRQKASEKTASENIPSENTAADLKTVTRDPVCGMDIEVGRGACQQSCVWVMDSRRAFESRLKHRVELGESGSNGT